MNELTILTSLLRKAPATPLSWLDVQAVTQAVHIAEFWAGFSWITLVLLKGFTKPGVEALTRTFNKLSIWIVQFTTSLGRIKGQALASIPGFCQK